MKKMYQSLIRQYANVVAERVCDGVIEDLKQITTTLSGDDSGLRNTWEEICVQVQGEESFFWDEYQTVMQDAILGAIVAVEQRDLASLWLQSEEGWSWRWDMENADDDAANAEVTEIPFVQEEIAKHILQKHLMVRAEDYSNQRIAAFLGKDDELDEDSDEDEDEVDEDEHDEPYEDESVESKSHQMVVAELNATPLSQHLANLMKAQRVTPAPGNLILVELMQWSVQNHYQNKTQGEMEYGTVVEAMEDDPEATYNNLADDPRYMQATTLDEAASVLSSVLTELLD